MIRLGVDIGGTFTDVVLDTIEQRWTTKVLTTGAAPEEGLIDGVMRVLERAQLGPDAVDFFAHGTTLATNALIERRGAKTAFVTTDGFRDTLETAYESRFEQYNINIDLPPPLVRRKHRLTVRGRIDAHGKVLVPLSEDDLRRAADTMQAEAIASVAIGFINSYANPEHEERAREIIAERSPGLLISLSCEVSPEMREYERFSTACANAYVKPLMAGYLRRLQARLAAFGLRCPMFLMLSGGGITTVETAAEFPVRLIESGPAGGAVYAARVAAECGAERVLSFDMGGTTAKVCFIDNGVPQKSRRFEVARTYRFKRGSGLPLRIPVVEMVEIGAGGGSIAGIDPLGSIRVGPLSAGSNPGPACYARGGRAPTVTDADVVLGRIDPTNFAGGSISLDPAAARDALTSEVGAHLGIAPEPAALGVAEIVDENMANAARMHAIETGRVVGEQTLVAFGGAAPIHALQVARRLGISRVVIPTGAGVGSAIGFLQAPVSYEVTRSLHQCLEDLDPGRINPMLEQMHRAASAVVQPAVRHPLREERMCFMRYRGQGFELAIALPNRPVVADDAHGLHEAFEDRFRAVYGRTVPGAGVEILSWSLTLTSEQMPRPEMRAAPAPASAHSDRQRPIYDGPNGRFILVPVYARSGLRAGAHIRGPALIEETETTTVITADFDATVDAYGYLVCLSRQ